MKNLKLSKWVNEKLEVVDVVSLKKLCGRKGSIKNLKWLKWGIEKLEMVELGLCIGSCSLNRFILWQRIDRMKLFQNVRGTTPSVASRLVNILSFFSKFYFENFFEFFFKNPEFWSHHVKIPVEKNYSLGREKKLKKKYGNSKTKIYHSISAGQ